MENIQGMGGAAGGYNQGESASAAAPSQSDTDKFSNAMQSGGCAGGSCSCPSCSGKGGSAASESVGGGLKEMLSKLLPLLSQLIESMVGSANQSSTGGSATNAPAKGDYS